MKQFKFMYKLFVIGILILAPLLSFNIQADASGTFTREEFGTRSYSLFVPSGYVSGEPVALVVMIHGCTQNAADFAAGTGMNQIAQRDNFIVLYPEQPLWAHDRHCWNFFETVNQRRGQGEPQVIVDMVQEVKSNFTINPNAVFAAGLSSGGATVANLGVLYPDVFTAISVNAGLSFQSGINTATALSAMFNAIPVVNPVVAANTAFNQLPANTRRVVPTIVFHGSFDTTVNPLNGDNVVTQMLTFNGRSDATINIFNRTLRTGTAAVANGRTYSVESFRNGAGQVVIEHHRINQMGHDWSGGHARGSHTDPRGPNASEISWQFFQNAARNRR